jgi:hypothetical protein
MFIYLFILREKHRRRVFENRVFRKLLGPERDEAPAEWRRLHKEEVCDMNSVPIIIRVIKSRRMSGGRGGGWAWGRGEVYTGFCWGDRRERDPLEDPGVDGRIILHGNFQKQDW